MPELIIWKPTPASLRRTAEAPLEQFIFLCVLNFPPNDEVYFAIVIDDARKFNKGLLKLYNEGVERNKTLKTEGKKEGSISNNVKFYITDTGNVFFHNYDFHESLTGTEHNPDCQALISAIYYSIWPPAISARRSLLARDFVGYLGSLVGHEKIHEMQIWHDVSAVHPDMCRMPVDIPIGEIEAAVKALGGFYPGGEIRRFHAGLNFLNHKHFVILSGLSGTGKTQLALNYARAAHGVTDSSAQDPFLFVCPVRPEWTDPTGLTGYYDVLSNRYMVPPFLEAVMLATAHRDSPVFVVLDEMNLARVEYYFSDVLSCIETGEPLQLHSNGVPLESSTGSNVRAEMPLPPNLFVIGTINIDETTNPVSDKVLDRAIIIDMSAVQLHEFFSQLQKREPSLSDAYTVCGEKLVSVHNLMAQYGLGFGYRVAEEVIRYHAFVQEKLGSTAEEIEDDLMVQKVLVKLRGAEKQRGLLTELLQMMDGLPYSTAFLKRLTEDLDEFGSFQAGR